MQRREAASTTERKQLKALEILTRIHASQTPGFRLQGWGLWPIVVAQSSDFLKGDLKGKKELCFSGAGPPMVTSFLYAYSWFLKGGAPPTLMTRLLHDNNIISYHLPFVTVTCTTESSLP